MAKILVVDDDVNARNLLSVVIKKRGGDQVFFATNGIEALQVAWAELPDLVITDIQMPMMDGYEFVRQLRADPILKKTEVIFYSAYFFERAGAFGKALSLGVTNVLFKPIDSEEIVQAIETALLHVKHHT